MDGLSRQNLRRSVFPPLGVALGNLWLALGGDDQRISLLFIRPARYTRVIDTVAGVTARTLPVPPAELPPADHPAVARGIRRRVSHLRPSTYVFHYNLYAQRDQLIRLHLRAASGPAGGQCKQRCTTPLLDGHCPTRAACCCHQFPNARRLNIVRPSDRLLSRAIYAQIPKVRGKPQPSGLSTPPLQRRQRDYFRGRRPFPPDRLAPTTSSTQQMHCEIVGILPGMRRATRMYSVRSGVTVFPVGFMNRVSHLQLPQEDLVLSARQSSCNA